MSYTTATRLLYLLAMVLEVGGVLLVIVDVWLDRGRARGYVDAPRRVRIPWQRASWTIQAALEDRDIAAGGYMGQTLQRQREQQQERNVQRVALGAAEAEMEYRRVIADILRGNVYRRLGGPALIIAGIVLGTIANLRAL